MTFEQVLPELKKGYSIKRSGTSWDVMYIILVETGEIRRIMIQNGNATLPWQGRDYDLLADDWEVQT